MPFADDEIEGAEPDGWTGKAGALVYQDPAEVAAWLVRNGYPAFAAADEDAQTAALLRATRAAELAVRPYFQGATFGGGLLFPADGAYDARGALRDDSQPPSEYLQGIALLAEAVADGSFLSFVQLSGISAESNAAGSISYSGSGAVGMAGVVVNEAWQLVKVAIPRFI
jgi:hypothetical protein